MASRALIAGVTDAASKGSRIIPNESTTRTAVVVGATGIIGRAIAAKLAGLGGWRVLGVARSGGAVRGFDEAIAVDQQLGGGPPATGPCRRRDPPVLRGLPPPGELGGGRRASWRQCGVCPFLTTGSYAGSLMMLVFVTLVGFTQRRRTCRNPRNTT
jgi:hypothetical protein